MSTEPRQTVTDDAQASFAAAFGDKAKKHLAHRIKMFKRQESKKMRFRTFPYVDRSRYTGETIRKLTAERGCGCQWTKAQKRSRQSDQL